MNIKKLLKENDGWLPEELIIDLLKQYGSDRQAASAIGFNPARFSSHRRYYGLVPANNRGRETRSTEKLVSELEQMLVKKLPKEKIKQKTGLSNMMLSYYVKTRGFHELAEYLNNSLR